MQYRRQTQRESGLQRAKKNLKNKKEERDVMVLRKELKIRRIARVFILYFSFLFPSSPPGKGICRAN